jgi:polyisoprenoid-binding protein YceI
MKNRIFKILGATTLVLAMISFSANSIKMKTIDTKKSKIEWEGEKLTGSHEGTIMFRDGYLEMDGEKITAGEFTVDMTSIVTTDLSGEGKQKLEGHLKSDDFFGVTNYPTAKLKIKNATKKGDSYGIIADLTIKNITKPVTFDLEMNNDSANAELTIDRTEFGVKYGSGSFFDNLGDNVIYDDFELDISLKF